MEFWLISIPNNKDAKKANEDLREIVTSRQAEFFVLDKLPISRLRVGTIDKLILLSDELGRIDRTGQTLVQKLHKTYTELEKSDQSLSVYNNSISGYIQHFEWDEGHFNLNATLKDLVTNIQSNMNKTAEHLRKWQQTLSSIQNSLQTMKKKTSGSLMTKSLREYITPQDWHEGEYLRSALVVIPLQKEEEFLSQYETLEKTEEARKYIERLKNNQQQMVVPHDHKEDNKEPHDQNQNQNQDQNQHQNLRQDNLHEHQMANIYDASKCPPVVPGSAKRLHKDAENLLYQVLVLVKGYEWFKHVCREKGYNARDFSLNELNEEDEKKQVEELQRQEVDQQKKLQLFCKNTFSETFANWIHLKTIRAFVESVLRFGLPVDFSIDVVKPYKGSEKKLLKHLEQRYSHLLDEALRKPSAENEVDYSGLGQEFYPFVYVPIKVEL